MLTPSWVSTLKDGAFTVSSHFCSSSCPGVWDLIRREQNKGTPFICRSINPESTPPIISFASPHVLFPAQSPQDLITAAVPDHRGQSLHLGPLELCKLVSPKTAYPAPHPFLPAKLAMKLCPALPSALLPSASWPPWCFPWALRCVVCPRLQGSVCPLPSRQSGCVPSLTMHNEHTLGYISKQMAKSESALRNHKLTTAPFQAVQSTSSKDRREAAVLASTVSNMNGSERGQAVYGSPPSSVRSPVRGENEEQRQQEGGPPPHGAEPRTGWGNGTQVIG